MMRGLLIVMLMVPAFAGCIGEADGVDTTNDDETPLADESFTDEAEDVEDSPRDAQGVPFPQVARRVAFEGPTRVVGFQFPVHPDEWTINSFGWAQAWVQTATTGAMSSWSVSVFDEEGVLIGFITHNDEILLAPAYGTFVGLVGEPEPASAIDITDFDGERQNIHVVVAGEGTGEVFVRMARQGWDADAQEIQDVGVIDAEVIGETDCYSAAGYLYLWAFWTLGFGFQYGDMEVDYGPVPNEEANKVTNVRTNAPDGCGGWRWADAFYITYQGPTYWNADVTGDDPDHFQGVVVYEANTLNAATLVTGFAGWSSVGPNEAPFGSRFEVIGVSNDLVEAHSHMQLTYGAPLSDLIGRDGHDPFQGAAYGLVGEIPVPRISAAADGTVSVMLHPAQAPK